MNEDAVFKKIVQQDQGSLETLMNEYGLLVLRVIRQIVGSNNSIDAEECACDVWLTIWQKATQYDSSKSSLKTWICTIARNRAIDQLRKLNNPANNAVSLDDDRLNLIKMERNDISEILIERESRQSRAEAMNHALGLMSAVDRELLIRRYYYYEDITKLADDFGITREAVDNRLSRNRKLLKSLYLEVQDENSR